MQPRQKAYTIGYVTSFVLHGGLLLLFAFMLFHNQPVEKSLQVDWFTEPNTAFAPRQAIMSGENIGGRPGTPDKNMAPRQSVNPGGTAPLTSTNTDEPSFGAPQLNNTPGNNKLSFQPGSGYQSSIKGKINNPGGGSGYLFDEEGDIAILKKVLPNPQLTDYGKVTLEFQIDSNGDVVTESIKPLQIDDASYTHASIQALQQWRFQAKGVKPGKRFRISFIFNPI